MIYTTKKLKDKKFAELCLTNTKRVKCNCGRIVKAENVMRIDAIDINTFDWWYYEVIDSIDNTKIVKGSSKFWWIGFIPLIREIPYYIHQWFHKPDYVFAIECKYCENE